MSICSIHAFRATEIAKLLENRRESSVEAMINSRINFFSTDPRRAALIRANIKRKIVFSIATTNNPEINHFWSFFEVFLKIRDSIIGRRHLQRRIFVDGSDTFGKIGKKNDFSTLNSSKLLLLTVKRWIKDFLSELYHASKESFIWILAGDFSPKTRLLRQPMAFQLDVVPSRNFSCLELCPRVSALPPTSKRDLFSVCKLNHGGG